LTSVGAAETPLPYRFRDDTLAWSANTPLKDARTPLDTYELTFFRRRRFDDGSKRKALLTEAERATLRKQEERRQLCGSSWVMIERTRLSGPAVVRDRQAVRRACKMRDCNECGPIELARRADRVKGPWTHFVTLTVPTDVGDSLDCWRWLPAWRRRFLAWLRHAYNSTSSVVASDVKIEYAWVAEATARGYPHLHVCLSQTPPPMIALHAAWAAAIGVRQVVVDVGPIKDRSASCSYLCKYVSKWCGSAEILAVLGRNRLWGRTDDHLARNLDDGWRVVEADTVDVWEAAEGLVSPGIEPGWNTIGREEQWWASWTRYDLPIARQIPESVGCVSLRTYDLMREILRPPDRASDSVGETQVERVRERHEREMPAGRVEVPADRRWGDSEYRDLFGSQIRIIEWRARMIAKDVGPEGELKLEHFSLLQ